MKNRLRRNQRKKARNLKRRMKKIKMRRSVRHCWAGFGMGENQLRKTQISRRRPPNNPLRGVAPRLLKAAINSSKTNRLTQMKTWKRWTNSMIVHKKTWIKATLKTIVMKSQRVASAQYHPTGSSSEVT